MAYDLLTDSQWDWIKELLPAAKPGGRPRKVQVRSVVEAILYVLKTGCQWRMLPEHYPHWRTVYGYFVEWRENGVLRRIQKHLYQHVRIAEGKDRPTMLIIDSQSVKTTKMGGDRGYDGGKRVKGRKRHLVVDSLGMILGVSITAANVHDTVGVKKALERVKRLIGKTKIQAVSADGAYGGKPFRQWVRQKFNAAIHVAKNLAQKAKAFVPVKHRWKIERTFSWIMDYRRLSLDYERMKVNSNAMIRWASISIMLRRLTTVE